MTTTKPHSARKVDIEELTRRRMAGQTGKQIAEHFGVNPRTIQRNLFELGLTNPNPAARWRATPEWKAEVENLFAEGLPISEIARTTGVTFPTVTRHFPGRGWPPAKVGAHGAAIRRANRDLRKAGHRPLPAAERV